MTGGPCPPAVPVPLDDWFDNDGIDTAEARGGSFDGSGYTFPCEELPAGDREIAGTTFRFPAAGAGAKNNIVALGQRIDLPPGRYLSALHIFALSLQPAAEGRALAVRDAHSTTSLLDHGAQSVEATVVNAGTVGILAADGLTLSVDVPGARTVAPARVTRLAPGDQARVRIGIRNRPGTSPGTARDGSVVARGRGQQAATVRRSLTLGVPDYTPTDASLSTHQAPYWFQDAKFGIFIHWGIYSVPAWAPVGTQYAEWYWNQMQTRTTPPATTTATPTASPSPTTTSSRGSAPNTSTPAPGWSCSGTPARSTTSSPRNTTRASRSGTRNSPTATR